MPRRLPTVPEGDEDYARYVSDSDEESNIHKEGVDEEYKKVMDILIKLLESKKLKGAERAVIKRHTGVSLLSREEAYAMINSLKQKMRSGAIYNDPKFYRAYGMGKRLKGGADDERDIRDEIWNLLHQYLTVWEQTPANHQRYLDNLNGIQAEAIRQGMTPDEFIDLMDDVTDEYNEVEGEDEGGEWWEGDFQEDEDEDEEEEEEEEEEPFKQPRPSQEGRKGGSKRSRDEAVLRLIKQIEEWLEENPHPLMDEVGDFMNDVMEVYSSIKGPINPAYWKRFDDLWDRLDYEMTYAQDNPDLTRPSSREDARDLGDGSGRLRKKLEGAGLWDFVKDVFTPSKVINEITNPDSVSRRRISDVTKGIRTDYPPSARKTLEKYGGWTIVGLNLRRDPVESAINTAFNLITLGQWNKAKSAENMDKLFHLGIVVTLENAGDTHQLIVEKNEVINIGPLKPVGRASEFAPVPTPSPPMTLTGFLKRAEEKKGADFFKYDPFGNNCQDFVATLLMMNGVYTPQAKAFVKQDVAGLVSRLPGYTHAVARGITDLGALANVAVEGGAGRATPRNPDAFARQLKKAGLEPSSYLEEARRRAKEHHYPYKLLGFASDGNHKLAIPDKNGRMVAFGKVGYGDHIIYSHLEKAQKVPKGTADAKKNTFQKSHSKIRGDWASKPFSPNNLALRVLW